VQIEVHACSFRSTRGYTTVCALLDEIAVWQVDEESADPDVEVINSLRPGMLTIPNAMLLVASSPHAQKGALWETYRQHYGHDDDDVLVWRATTTDMHPSVPQGWIDQQLARDHARASADYLAEFRSDLEGFVARDAVMACVVAGLRERPPDPGVFHYRAFVDMSGGSVDSAALVIAHNDSTRRVVVLDLVREVKAPHSPEQTVAEFCAALKLYKVYTVYGDAFAKEWPVEVFRRYGITYQQAGRNRRRRHP
jgi:hypothetical protein